MAFKIMAVMMVGIIVLMLNLITPIRNNPLWVMWFFALGVFIGYLAKG
jgi:hypothetical protein